MPGLPLITNSLARRGMMPPGAPGASPSYSRRGGRPAMVLLRLPSCAGSPSPQKRCYSSFARVGRVARLASVLQDASCKYYARQGIGAERRAETAAPSRNETKSSQAAGEVGEDLVTPGRHVRTWAARADQFLTLPRCSRRTFVAEMDAMWPASRRFPMVSGISFQTDVSPGQSRTAKSLSVICVWETRQLNLSV